MEGQESKGKDAPQAVPAKGPTALAKKKHGWDFYRSIGSPRFVLSPMVGQSELAFRMLCRRHGAQVAYTPMFIASKFVESAAYRKALWQTCPADRPLIVQFCANDPALLVAAGKLVQADCDAVDINLGCPQEVAQRGGYGAYLMEHQTLVRALVAAAARELAVPVTVKIRIFDDYARTLAYCLLLQEAGASLITIHPRLRHHREEVLADWSVVVRVRRQLRIPVVLNGDLWHSEDVANAISLCEVDGFMSAQGILHNPAIFEPFVGDRAKDVPPQPPTNEAGPSASPAPAVGASAAAARGAAASEDASANADPVFLSTTGEQSLRVRRKDSPFFAHAFNLAFEHPLVKAEQARAAERQKLVARALAVTAGTTAAAAAGAGAASSGSADAKQQPQPGSSAGAAAAAAGGAARSLAATDHPLCVYGLRPVFTNATFPARFRLGDVSASPEDARRQFALAHEYVQCAATWPPAHASIVRRHLFFILFDFVQANVDQYRLLCEASTVAAYVDVVDTLQDRARRGVVGGGFSKGGDRDDDSRPLARRRDGTIAPPPWPVGGGGLNVAKADGGGSGGGGGGGVQVAGAGGAGGGASKGGKGAPVLGTKRKEIEQIYGPDGAAGKGGTGKGRGRGNGNKGPARGRTAGPSGARRRSGVT